ncbi:MAG: hypothetical protein LBL86_08305 [Coriobacteriales bacterium]|nr:hypothetical protein [Coriobacteriales bacterium]
MSLERMQETIALLHGGIIVCIVLAVFFLGLAVLFFFRFHILQIIQQKTGVTARRELAAFNEQNSMATGQLARSNSIALGERTPAGLAAAPSKGLGKPRSRRLGSKRLSGAPPPAPPPLQPPPPVPEGFVLIKEALVIHTDAGIS